MNLKYLPLLLVLALFGSAAADDAMGWKPVRGRLGRLVQYPANLFPDRHSEIGTATAVFARNSTSSVLIWNIPLRVTERPFKFVCPTECPAPIYRLDKPFIAAVSGYIDTRVYYSKCMLAWTGGIKEMHCFHLIYPRSESRTYDPVVIRMSESLR